MFLECVQREAIMVLGGTVLGLGSVAAFLLTIGRQARERDWR